MMNTM
ncbi:hypothetical protein D039_1442A, partial [Vibrio parahaemolyticus EKP-028]